MVHQQWKVTEESARCARTTVKFSGQTFFVHLSLAVVSNTKGKDAAPGPGGMEKNGPTIPRNCQCMGDGECVYCDGKGIITYIQQDGWIYDEKHGWITDPDAEGPPTERKVTKKCDMCENGKCGVCGGTGQRKG